MIYAVAIEGLIALALIALLFVREYSATLERTMMRDSHEAQTQSLLTRIQHPEIVQPRSNGKIAPVAPTAYPPPKDLPELAHLGDIVPEGLSVGHIDAIVAEEIATAEAATQGD